MTQATAVTAGVVGFGRALAAFRESAFHHRWLIGVVTVYALAVSATLGGVGRELQLFNWTYVISAVMPVVSWAFFLLIGSGIEAFTQTRSLRWSPIATAFRRSEFFTLSRLAHIAIPLLLLPIFSSAFSSYKSAIPALSPFSYDLALSELDRWVHFGYDPWQILQPLLGYPLVTATISYLYNLWLLVLYLFIYVIIYKASDLRFRMQYLLTFAALWIIVGSLMATGLSSAGPCYFEAVTGLPSPYAPLMAYLNEANESYRVWALDGQAYLWDAYSSTELSVGGGISAMPSMHVAIATLQALAAWRLGRKVGWLLTAYLPVILLGSVHLGWHYALDGYVSMALTVALWFGMGRLLARTRIGGSSVRSASPDVSLP